jgi:pathogenesis-related protein 1
VGYVLIAVAVASCQSSNSTEVIGGDIGDGAVAPDSGITAITFPSGGADGAVVTPPGDGGAVVATTDSGAHDAATMTTPDATTMTGTPDATGPVGTGTGSGTGTGTGSGATAAENEWLVPQNAARAAVGEGPMTWDPIAAAVATAYANGCDYIHNPNRQSQYDAMSGNTLYIGENIAAGEPTESVAEACSDWIDEKQYYSNSPGGGTCNAPSVGGQPGECGHYTQIVWNTTTGVGCAQATCGGSTSPFGDGNSWVYSVCDYSPGGNIVGSNPY